MIADEVNMNRETIPLIPTEEWGTRKIGAQECHRAAVGFTAKRSF
jgi:hypothetical protein